jgi:hypothetical protein
VAVDVARCGEYGVSAGQRWCDGVYDPCVGDLAEEHHEEKLMSRRLPVVLSLAALGLALAGPAAASAAAGEPTRVAACTADTPAVKALVAALAALKDALPDPAKTQAALGDVYKAILGVQQAGCLPPLPTGPPAPPAQSSRAADTCLAATVNLLGAVLGGIGATLAVPPDATALNSAASKLADAVKAINDGKCLPVPLTVPGVPALPAPPMLPAP